MTPSPVWPLASANVPRLYDRAATLLAPTPRTTPAEWGARNRRYPITSGLPGPRDPFFTPYLVPFGRAFSEAWAKRVVQVAFAQGGKTDTVLDVIGERFDTRPAPGLYVGPSKEFLTDQFEPRVMALLDEAPRLKSKVARGKRNKKTLKIISGVRLRLAHAGSSTALKSDPAAWAIVDEYDEMLANVKGQGDVGGLVEARGDTYADFCTGYISTPGKGSVDVELDDATGLELWKPADPKDIESPIWKKWQEGTGHHLAWRCPHCSCEFVPRFRNLRWPEKSTPAQAKRSAWVECPHCDGRIEERHKPELNATAAYVAPGGHRIEMDGSMSEPLPDTSTVSFWASGLASPFKTFGDRAETFLLAAASGDPNQVQTAINAGFGELFVPGGGEAPEWKEVAALRGGYRLGEVPEGVALITGGVDVQKDRLVYVVRGWGAKATSWLIDRGEVYDPDGGSTTEPAVWEVLGDLVAERFADLALRLAFIDSGYRPGKPWQVPENRVYEFCRRFARSTRATKGHDTQSKPLVVRKHEVTAKGKVARYGLDLVHLDTDYWKSWIFERIRWPREAPGAWHLPEDVDDEYCQQIVSETRVVLPSGRVQWKQRSKQNHYFDAECMAAAAGYMLNAHHIGEAFRRRPPPDVGAVQQAVVAQQARPQPERPRVMRSRFLSQQ
jgi:phage terminase large subunit GpA-like protein